MKNYLLLTASAVLVLSSCSNNEIIENNDAKNAEPTKMSIATYVPGLTRANFEAWQAADTSLVQRGFVLAADFVGEDDVTENLFLENIEFDSEDGWIASDPEASLQWPSDPTTEVQFFAAYSVNPLADGAIDDDTEYGKIWNMPNGVSGKEDLMAASTATSLEATGRDGGTLGQVSLTFEHILSQVEVKFVGTTPGYLYRVGLVRLQAPNSRVFTFSDNVFEEQSDTIYNLDNVDNISIGQFNDKNSEVIEGNEVTTTASTYASLMVVPGTCRLTLGYSVVMDGESNDVKEVNDGISFEALQGVKTVVLVKLNPETRSMTFSVSVEPWTNADQQEFDL